MEFRKKQAIYMQIADHILDHVLAERWKTGEKIQSVREFAANMEVNPNTVMRTYTYLQDKGVIFNKRGIGYFVSDDALEKTRALKKRDFVEQFLPRVFHTMDLLGMSLEDLQERYEKHKVS